MYICIYLQQVSENWNCNICLVYMDCVPADQINRSPQSIFHTLEHFPCFPVYKWENEKTIRLHIVLWSSWIQVQGYRSNMWLKGYLRNEKDMESSKKLPGKILFQNTYILMLKVVGKLLVCIFIRWPMRINALWVYEQRIRNWELFFFWENTTLLKRKHTENPKNSKQPCS